MGPRDVLTDETTMPDCPMTCLAFCASQVRNELQARRGC
jgi:hypothetical protein